MIRARVAAESDLDMILKTKDPVLMERALASPFGYKVRKHHVVLGPPPANPILLRWMGPAVSLGNGDAVLEDRYFLRRLFSERREKNSSRLPEREFPPEKTALWKEIQELSKELESASSAPEIDRLKTRIAALSEKLMPTIS